MFNSAEERLGCVGNVDVTPNQTVVNCFSQLTFGTAGKHTSYLAVARCFDYIRTVFSDETIAIPYLYGCGLGGGNWVVVEALIEEAFGDRVTIYKLKD